MKPLLSPDGRRAAAFLVVLGGCVTMTLYAVAVLYLVRGQAVLAFWLGLAAHLHILLGLTAFAALWIKRSIKASRDGIEITDDAIKDGDAVTISKEPGQ